MNEENRPTQEELAEAAEQHRQLHYNAFKMIQAAVHNVAETLQCAGNETEEVWCAIESACRAVGGEAGVQMHIAELRAIGAPESFIGIIEDVVNFGVEMNSGELDRSLATKLTNDDETELEATTEEDGDDDEPRWGDEEP